jgi:hypothetical protein
MKRTAFRIALVAIFPFILAWSFIATLVYEIGQAFKYAWLEVRIETGGFRKEWRRPGLTSKRTRQK